MRPPRHRLDSKTVCRKAMDNERRLMLISNGQPATAAAAAEHFLALWLKALSSKMLVPTAL